MMLTMQNKTRCITVSICLFIGYFTFLLWGSYHLPNAAGPDEHANIETIRFYQNYKRLAVFPDDVDKTKLTAYGSTRLNRPPFPFVAASISDSFVKSENSPYFGARISTSITLALCVVVFFQIGLALGASLLSSLSSTIIATIIPQFLFHGVYINDDAGAFLFSATLTLIFINIIKRETLTPKLLFISAATCGLIIINKLTAWMILPAFAVAVTAHLLQKRRYLQLPQISYWLIAVGIFICTGFFWIIYNVSLYGFSDPLQQNISQQLMDANGHVRAAGQRGYGPLYGIYHFDLIQQYAFLKESFRALIGRLGLIEIVLNPITYIWYALVSVFAVISFFIFGYLNIIRPKAERDSFFLPLLLFSVLWIGIQFTMYIHFNVRVDIQIQGKYLLPALPILVIFLSYGLDYLKERFAVSQELWQPSIVFITFALVGLSLFTRIIPFYNPPAYRIYMHQQIPLNLNDPAMFEVIANLEHQKNGDYFSINATQTDPLIIFVADMCDVVGTNFVLDIEFEANQADVLRVYIDEGEGFRNKFSYRHQYQKGHNSAHLPIAVDKCKYIRIDPMEHIETKITKVRANLTPFHAQKSSIY